MERTIEVWSNREKTEFGARPSGDSVFKAVTSVKEKSYENVVAKLPYLEDYEYNWIFVLRHWLNNNADEGYSEIAKKVRLV